MKAKPNVLQDILNNKQICDALSLLRGQVKIEHYDVRGRLVSEQEAPNGITNVGKDKILNDMFNGGTQTANNSWFIGLIDNASFTALAAADTMASHGGWVEFTSYSQATRVAWGSGTSTAQSTTNATPAQFDITATGNIYGVFITTVGTKSGTTGILWATAGFSSVVPVNNGDQLKCTYTVSC